MTPQVTILKEKAGMQCPHCRYWFQRCCHALALIDGGDKSPGACLHFVTQGTPPHPLLEGTP